MYSIILNYLLSTKYQRKVPIMYYLRLKIRSEPHIQFSKMADLLLLVDIAQSHTVKSLAFSFLDLFWREYDVFSRT